MSTIWDEIDDREARYKAEVNRTLDQVKDLVDRRFPATCDDCGRAHEAVDGHTFTSPIGAIVLGQDEFGWWRASVKLCVGFTGPERSEVWRDLTYQARSSEGLVQAVRERKEAP